MDHYMVDPVLSLKSLDVWLDTHSTASANSTAMHLIRVHSDFDIYQ